MVDDIVRVERIFRAVGNPVGFGREGGPVKRIEAVLLSIALEGREGQFVGDPVMDFLVVDEG